MNFWFTSFFVAFITLTSCSAQTSHLVELVNFKTGSRGGGYEEVAITAGQTTIKRGGRLSDSSEPTVVEIKTTRKQWDAIQDALSEVKLDTISKLQSPTMARAYDGASHSSISITPVQGQSCTHSFDDERPHALLLPLMQLIAEIKNNL